MARKPKQYDDDDGHTIADMNVEGMPWYVDRKERRDDGTEKPKLTWRESLAMMGGVLKATLLVGLLLFGLIALFILLCDYVIFR